MQPKTEKNTRQAGGSPCDVSNARMREKIKKRRQSGTRTQAGEKRRQHDVKRNRLKLKDKLRHSKDQKSPRQIPIEEAKKTKRRDQDEKPVKPTGSRDALPCETKIQRRQIKSAAEASIQEKRYATTKEVRKQHVKRTASPKPTTAKGRHTKSEQARRPKRTTIKAAKQRAHTRHPPANDEKGKRRPTNETKNAKITNQRTQ